MRARIKILWIKLKREGLLLLTSFFDFFGFLFSSLGSKKHGLGPGFKTVVFVGEFLPPRIGRISKWLRKTPGYKTILVCARHGYVKSFGENDFDKIYLFRNQWHMKSILRSLGSFYVLHGFAPKSRYPNLARKFCKSTPYVHDMQDVLVTYYGTQPPFRWARQEMPHEKECLAFADGVVAHSLEPNEGFRMFGIKKKPATLFFPLYCDDDVFVDSKTDKPAGEIHIVYAGGVAGSHRNKKQYGAIQFQGLIKILSAQKIHFHVYPSPSTAPADYEEYTIIAKENPWFHLHDSVSQDKLSVELGKYHFGLVPFFAGASGQSKVKYKYATALKIFNFLEAGLPVITSNDMTYQSWIIRRYFCGISINTEDLSHLKETINHLNYYDLTQSVQKARSSQLSIRKQMTRLHTFYSSVRKKMEL